MKFSMQRVKQGLGELQTTLRWAFTMQSKPTAISGDFPENLQIRCSSTSLPTATRDTMQIELQGHVINHPGKTTKNGEITLNFIEGVDAAVAAFFLEWDQARWSTDGDDSLGVQAPTAELKADCKIELLNNSDEVTQTYDLIGCMASYEAGAELGQTSEAFSPTVTIQYDTFKHTAGGRSW